MPPPKGNAGEHGDEHVEFQGEAPRLMVEQAEAAVASQQKESEQNTSDKKQAGGHAPSKESHDLPDVPPRRESENLGTMKNEAEGFGTEARVADDGRVNIRIDQRTKKLSNLLVPALRHQQDLAGEEEAPPPAYIPPSLGGEKDVPPPPPMNVVVQVVGSRGDVQPFVALGKVLKDTYGHRVRLATHPNFKQFVTENGLEFFNIGGDPAALMAFMVKNPGLMPGFDTLRSGDVGSRRKEVAAYLKGCWRSCFEAGDGLGPAVSDETVEDWSSAPSPAEESDANNKPFVADCIIANPPSFAHVHCAEKLGIPLHIMFTMPYSPTQAFPHPLANIQSTNADPHLTNYMTYALVDMLTWQGLGDVINRFREKSLGLEEISLIWAPGMMQRLKIPHTYCWSPNLIPKPKDWGQSINISGFFFLNLASNYTPEPDLKAFLDAGPPPVYIGFGSIVLDDPDAMTQLVFEAARVSGQRVLLSKGWGGMGAEDMGVPDNVFMLGNVPHDWLFKHVSCVVHHGGAGTTAAGITAGKPTVVVPFFGDQPFWGSMVSRAGAGPDPLPHKELTGEKLAEAINFCLKAESQERAQDLASKIAKEEGSQVGAQSFHQFLDVDKLRCAVSPSRAAVWRVKRTSVRLSAFAACVLANEGLLDFNDLKLFRGREYETDDGPWDPISGGATALIGTISTMMMGVADMPIQTLKALKIHPDATKNKKQPDEGEEQPAESSGMLTPSSSTADVSAVSEKDSRRGSNTTTQSGTVTPSATESTSGTTDAKGETLTPATSRSGSSFNFQQSLDKMQSGPSPGNLRSTTMKGVLKDQLKDAQNRSSGKDPKQKSEGDGQYLDTAVGTSKGVNRMIGAGFKSPLDFTMGVSKGFHNAPRLYGDDTVRKGEQVTDFRSGLRAATKEFGYGMYDGITGLVSQPLKGAQKEGPAGFVKGIGKGIGGIVFKPGAAIFGIPGYTMKGVYKEIQQHFGKSVQNYIIASRTAQGYDEMQKSTTQEREGVVSRYNALHEELKKKRNVDEIVRDSLRNWSSYSRSSSPMKGKGTDSPQRDGSYAKSSTTPSNAPPLSQQSGALQNEDIEEAIRLSVRQTSRGNPDDDAAVERAIRASMAELQLERAERAAKQQQQHQQEIGSTRASAAGQGDEDDDEDLKRAIAASAAEGPQQSQQSSGSTAQPDVEHDEELERVLAQSLKEQRRQRSSDSEWDSDDTADDEGYKQAIEASQQGHQISMTDAEAAPPPYDAGVSSASGGGDGKVAAPPVPEKTQQDRSEEEIVMEYVKKQSLLEAEHGGKGKGKSNVAADGEAAEDDEEMKRAMEESMKGNSGGDGASRA